MKSPKIVLRPVSKLEPLSAIRIVRQGLVLIEPSGFPCSGVVEPRLRWIPIGCWLETGPADWSSRRVQEAAFLPLPAVPAGVEQTRHCFVVSWVY